MMTSSNILLHLVMIVSALPYCRCLALNNHHHHDSGWDHFVFAQQWPMTSCIEANNITHEHDCRIPNNVTTWTVHGLWPSGKTSEGPSFCNTSSPQSDFNPESLQPILPQLEKYWPNLYAESELYCFWKHEWCKHGTCAVSLQAVNSEIKYFTKGLEIGKSFDLLSILRNEDILPKDDTTYQYTEFLSALEKGLGARPKLSCVYDKETKTQYIAAVEFCISKDFKMMECPENHHKTAKLVLSDSKQSNGITNMFQRKTYMGNPESCQQMELLSIRQLRQESQCRDTETLAYPIIKHSK